MITGSIVPPIALEAGDRVEYDLDGIGSVPVSLQARAGSVTS